MLRSSGPKPDRVRILISGLRCLTSKYRTRSGYSVCLSLWKERRRPQQSPLGPERRTPCPFQPRHIPRAPSCQTGPSPLFPQVVLPDTLAGIHKQRSGASGVPGQSSGPCLLSKVVFQSAYHICEYRSYYLVDRILLRLWSMTILRRQQEPMLLGRQSQEPPGGGRRDVQ